MLKIRIGLWDVLTNLPVADARLERQRRINGSVIRSNQQVVLFLES